MIRAAAATLALLAVLPGTALGAGSGLLGGFQPVAVEDGARAAWICPAGIGYGGASQLVLEGVFDEDADGHYGKLSRFTIAAATAGRAFGWQLETDDVTGVPDWTLVAGRVIGQSRGPRLGTALEYRGGEKNRFDATASLLWPIGRTLRAALAVEDLFESEVDGMPGRRLWRGGAAARGRSGWLSWDWRAPEGKRGRHFFGVGLDTRHFTVSGALDDDGGYEVELRLRLGERAAGGGFSEPDSGAGSRFAMVELGAPVRRVR